MLVLHLLSGAALNILVISMQVLSLLSIKYFYLGYFINMPLV